mgnify:FL=1
MVEVEVPFAVIDELDTETVEVVVEAAPAVKVIDAVLEIATPPNLASIVTEPELVPEV